MSDLGRMAELGQHRHRTARAQSLRFRHGHWLGERRILMGNRVFLNRWRSRLTLLSDFDSERVYSVVFHYENLSVLKV